MNKVYSLSFNFSRVENYKFLSNQYAEELLPNTIVQLIAAVCGILGNIPVLLMYGKYIEDKTRSRYFIPVLAFVDLVGCVSNAVHFYLQNTMSYNYPGVQLCKTLYFLNFFTGGFPAQLILVIALQRYLFICRPFGQQMTKTLCRISLLFIFLTSFGHSVPSLTLVGKEFQRNRNAYNISQHFVRCEIVDFSTKGVKEMISYLGITLLLSLAIICVTSALYIPVIRAMYRTLSPAEPSNHKDRYNDTSTRSAERRIPDAEKNVTEKFPKTYVRNSNYSIVDRNRKLKARQRITVMFLVIIIVYVVSYLTSLGTHIFIFIESRALTFTGYKLNILYMCLRLNLLNHIANPYIYWIFDIKFREELRRLCWR
ncbi:thyrotropin-releasing hormone receptor-like [Saccostrea cucullata]|uniref:thyrotropin-releasing hormone receptor-like n=1 Tax=Saccostrea cuccullata TaxID=36930 RepID=UPI002ED357A9